MNCLQKDWAIRDEEVRVRLVKVMGWLGGWRDDLPERDLRSDQNLEGLFWRFVAWTVSIQDCREWVAMALVMLLLISGREG